MSHAMRIVVGLTAAAAGLGGCVERTITITSEPAGALVYLNDREVGRTPVDVDFIHYGTYDVRLVKDGFEPLLTAADAEPPVWDYPGTDLLAELTPVTFRSDIAWHFVLEPVQSDRAALVDRARQARTHLAEAEFEAASDDETADAVDVTATGASADR